MAAKAGYGKTLFDVKYHQKDTQYTHSPRLNRNLANSRERERYIYIYINPVSYYFGKGFVKTCRLSEVDVPRILKANVSWMQCLKHFTGINKTISMLTF